MQFRWGRPDLAAYRARPSTPPASPTSPLTVSFLGVTTLLFDDGESAVMTDGFFTRPSPARTLLTPLRSDPARIDHALRTAGVDTLDAVACGHSHYDHALDSAAVAQRTGATLVGGESTAQLGRGARLPPDRIATVAPGEALTFGGFTLTFLESEHSHPDRIQGVIERAVAVTVEAGLRPDVDFLFGLPGEDEADRALTIALAERITTRGARVHGHAFMPLPGTPLAGAAPQPVGADVEAAVARLEARGAAYGQWRAQTTIASELVQLRARRPPRRT